MLIAALIAMHLTQGAWIKTLPDGHKVTLYAVSDGQVFWKPDGTIFRPDIDPHSFLVSQMPASASLRYLTAIVRFDTPGKGPWPSVAMSLAGTPLTDDRVGPEGELAIPPRAGRIVEALNGGRVPSDLVDGDLTVDCATGTWKEAGVYDLKKKRSTGLAFLPTVTAMKRESTDMHGNPMPNDIYHSIRVDITSPAGYVKPHEVRRVDAFSDKHVELEPGGSVSDPRKPTKLEYYFNTGEPAMGLPLVTPRYIVLQKRPSYVIVFRGVQLKPSR